MARADVKTTVEVTLVLTKKEAQFILGLVQNSFQEFESEENEQLRKGIWDAISSQGIELF